MGQIKEKGKLYVKVIHMYIEMQESKNKKEYKEGEKTSPYYKGVLLIPDNFSMKLLMVLFFQKSEGKIGIGCLRCDLNNRKELDEEVKTVGTLE